MARMHLLAICLKKLRALETVAGTHRYLWKQGKLGDAIAHSDRLRINVCLRDALLAVVPDELDLVAVDVEMIADERTRREISLRNRNL